MSTFEEVSKASCWINTLSATVCFFSERYRDSNVRCAISLIEKKSVFLLQP